MTHAHFNHIGSLAALVQAMRAATWMQALDIPVAEQGEGFRPMRAAPGLLRGVLFRIFVRLGQTVDPASIDHAIADGDVLPIAGGLRAIHMPGYCLGQIALLWPDCSVLFAGNALANLMGVGDPLGFEDRVKGRRSQEKLAALEFQVACFGHSKSIRAEPGPARASCLALRHPGWDADLARAADWIRRTFVLARARNIDAFEFTGV